MQFFQNYLGQKYGGILLSCIKIPLIVLYWKSRLLVDFKIRISIPIQKNENRILCIANEEMQSLHLTFNNRKSEEGQGDCLDKIKNIQDKESSSYRV